MMNKKQHTKQQRSDFLSLVRPLELHRSFRVYECGTANTLKEQACAARIHSISYRSERILRTEILLFLLIRAHISTSQPTEYELTMSLFCVKWSFTHFVLAFITSAIRQCNATSYLMFVGLLLNPPHIEAGCSHSILCLFFASSYYL